MKKVKSPKVLVGCPIHPPDSLYVDGYLEAVRGQDFGNLDIIFAETSGDEDFIHSLENTGAIVLRAKPEIGQRMEKIIAGREKIRQYFLEHEEYAYLWFVDADVRPPKSALSKLISDNKDLVAGVYLITAKVNGRLHILPCAYAFEKKRGYCRQLSCAEVKGSGMISIAIAGLGCALISRKVLKEISFRKFEEGGGEDAAFFIDCNRAGFETFLDKSVTCAHLVFPPGDARNKKFEL